MLLKLLVVGMYLSATPVMAGQFCSDTKVIKFAGITWESGQFMTELLRKILERGYGCKTEVVPGTTAATETALMRNDLQIWAEQWTGRTEIISRAVMAGKVVLTGDWLKDGADQGWYVPDYVVYGDARRNIKPSAPGLKSVMDLPKYKKLFADPEVPGKGRFLNCPIGWDCENISTRLLKALKLDNDFTNFRPGTGAALDAVILSSYQRGKAVVFYYWQPSSLMAKVKLVKLDMPAFNQACWESLSQRYAKATPCPSDMLVSRLKIGVSEPFFKAEPEIVQMFEKVALERSFLNGLIAEMNDQKITGSAMAERFLKDHPELWKAWLPEDKAQKIQLASLQINKVAAK